MISNKAIIRFAKFSIAMCMLAAILCFLYDLTILGIINIACVLMSFNSIRRLSK